MSATPRRTIASYEVERELGEGGMGVVYLARQPALERLVVVKGLRRDHARQSKADKRFLREAQTAAAIHHQNVVAVYDCFMWRGERFIAQEYVDGRDLTSVLEVVRRLAPRIAGLVAVELARGLEEIHARGIVHRDLKPSNVLVGRGGEVKIADFGIALDATGKALTKVGQAVGTPTYMSPEQFLGERVDARSDLFSFGILAYELLAGEPPFREEEEGPSLARRMQSGRYPSLRRLSPDAPRALVRLVSRCLRPKPRKRIGTAAALRRALERQLGDPSPADCRAEIAAWLWDRRVFVAEEDGTRVASRPARRRRRFPRALRWAAAAIAAAGLFGAALTLGRVELDPPPWIAGLLESAQTETAQSP